jgi:hypothetical protein
MITERLADRLKAVTDHAGQLSPEAQQAYKAYAQFNRDPSHPGLNFEIIDSEGRHLVRSRQ